MILGNGKTDDEQTMSEIQTTKRQNTGAADVASILNQYRGEEDAGNKSFTPLDAAIILSQYRWEIDPDTGHCLTTVNYRLPSDQPEIDRVDLEKALKEISIPQEAVEVKITNLMDAKRRETSVRAISIKGSEAIAKLTSALREINGKGFVIPGNRVRDKLARRTRGIRKLLAPVSALPAYIRRAIKDSIPTSLIKAMRARRRELKDIIIRGTRRGRLVSGQTRTRPSRVTGAVSSSANTSQTDSLNVNARSNKFGLLNLSEAIMLMRCGHWEVNGSDAMQQLKLRMHSANAYRIAKVLFIFRKRGIEAKVTNENGATIIEVQGKRAANLISFAVAKLVIIKLDVTQKLRNSGVANFNSRMVKLKFKALLAIAFRNQSVRKNSMTPAMETAVVCAMGNATKTAKSIQNVPKVIQLVDVVLTSSQAEPAPEVKKDLLERELAVAAAGVWMKTMTTEGNTYKIDITGMSEEQRIELLGVILKDAQFSRNCIRMNKERLGPDGVHTKETLAIVGRDAVSKLDRILQGVRNIQQYSGNDATTDLIRTAKANLSEADLRSSEKERHAEMVLAGSNISKTLKTTVFSVIANSKLTNSKGTKVWDVVDKGAHGETSWVKDFKHILMLLETEHESVGGKSKKRSKSIEGEQQSKVSQELVTRVCGQEADKLSKAMANYVIGDFVLNTRLSPENTRFSVQGKTPEEITAFIKALDIVGIKASHKSPKKLSEDGYGDIVIHSQSDNKRLVACTEAAQKFYVLVASAEKALFSSVRAQLQEAAIVTQQKEGSSNQPTSNTSNHTVAERTGKRNSLVVTG